MKNDYKLLEFEKVLTILSGFTDTFYAKEKIMELTPSNNFSLVNEMLTETKDAFKALTGYGSIPLGGLTDIKKVILRSKIGSLLNEEDLLQIVSLINTTNQVLSYFKTLDTLKIEYLSLKKYIDKLVLLNNLKSSILLSISEDGRVLDNASKELLMARRNLAQSTNRLKSKMNELLQTRASMLTDNIIALRNNRMTLPVKIEYKNSFKGIIHDESASHTTCYIEPESCIEINSMIETYTNEEKKEVEKILRSLSLLVSAESDTLLSNLEELTNLDIIFAKAKYAKEYDYYCPKINENGIIDLKKACHPLINKETVVPIDINIGKKFKTIIITGPNTGGKTVTLKTVGLLTLMMESGMFIPATKDSELSIFDSVNADIGDEQSIEQSLSTFSSHITKIINIIDNLTLNPLILLDELGSGTDPKEGGALATSIIDYLKNHGATTIATTHYSDLKSYAYNEPDVSNASVEFNSDTLKPTYRLLMGVPGKSNAILIAKRLGLNDKIIDMSQSKMNFLNTDTDNFMDKLDKESESLRNKEEALLHKISEYESLTVELRNEKQQIENETNKIINKARKEADLVLIKAKDEANELINSIKALETKNYKEHELAEVIHKTRNLNVDHDEVKVFDYTYKVGDCVYVKSYNKQGIIQKIKKDKYSVSIGQFEMDFYKNELEHIDKPIEKPKPKQQFNGLNPAGHSSLSLDLRGKRYDDVEFELDKFIDDACLSNAKQITIIHGFGTGTVRDAVQKYLKKCPVVQEFRYGKEGEGLNGVTIVYLK